MDAKALFDSVGQDTAEATEATKTAKVTKDGQIEELMNQALEERKSSEADFAQRDSILSSSLKLVGTCGIAGQKTDFINGELLWEKDEQGNPILDENGNPKPKMDKAGKKQQHEKVKVPAVVGYKVENIGQEPITVKTEKYAKNADGVYVGTVTDVVLKPGASMYLAHKWMVNLMSQVEVNSVMSNARMSFKAPKGGIKELPQDASANAELVKCMHIRFFGEGAPSVHADSVKEIIDKEVNGEYHIVDKKLLETFGYIENEGFKAGAYNKKVTTGKRGTRTAGASKDLKQQKIAAFAAKLISQQ